jgi:hypothetical protein
VNLDGKEDIDLAHQAETSLKIEQASPASPPNTRSPDPPATKSLSALAAAAAAARKPQVNGQSKLSGLSALKSDISVSASPQGLSKLAARAQEARKPLSSFASSSKSATPSNAVGHADQGQASLPSSSEEPTSKLSKLQQRIQHGNKVAGRKVEPDTAMQVEAVKEEKDVWVLPATTLFSSTAKINLEHSGFAEVIVPDHESHTMDARSSLITSQAVNAGRNTLPITPTRDVATSSVKIAANSLKPVRKL